MSKSLSSIRIQISVVLVLGGFLLLQNGARILWRPSEVKLDDAKSHGENCSPKLHRVDTALVARHGVFQGNASIMGGNYSKLCREFDDFIFSSDLWQPEEVSTFRGWDMAKCWDPEGKPMNWSENWPSRLCKRAFWRDDNKMGFANLLFKLGVVTFKGPFRTAPRVLHLPKGRDENAKEPYASLKKQASNYIKSIQSQECDYKTTKVAVLLIRKAGFGNEINRIFYGYHEALSLGLPLVVATEYINELRRSSFVELRRYQLFQDVVRPSGCQKKLAGGGEEGGQTKIAHMKDISETFKHYVFVAASREQMKPIPKRFSRLGPFVWMRLIAKIIFQPSLALVTASARGAGLRSDALDHLQSTVPNENQQQQSQLLHHLAEGNRRHLYEIWKQQHSTGSSTTVMDRFSRQYLGMHIRIGDSCSMVQCHELKRHDRPRHCVRELEPYLDVLIRRGIRRGDIYIATDSAEVQQAVYDFNSARALKGSTKYAGFRLFSTSMNRSRYAENPDQMIEFKKRIDPDAVLEELIIEISMLAGSTSVLGSFYSNVPRLAMALGNQPRYMSLDSRWCFQMGCPIWERNKNSHQTFAREHSFQDGSLLYLETAASWGGTSEIDKMRHFLDVKGENQLEDFIEMFFHRSDWNGTSKAGAFSVVPELHRPCSISYTDAQNLGHTIFNDETRRERLYANFDRYRQSPEKKAISFDLFFKAMHHAII